MCTHTRRICFVSISRRRLIGFITRSQIIVLLKRQHFIKNRSSDEDSFADSLAASSSRRRAPGARGGSEPLLVSGSLRSINQPLASRQRPTDMGDLGTADFRDAYPRYPDINTLHIPESEMNSLIDFRPYMNDSPYHMNYSKFDQYLQCVRYVYSP